MAVTVSVLSVAAGSVFIGILAPLVVHKTEDLQVVFFWQVPCWAAIVAWGAFSISDGPEDPPSAAAELQRLRRASTQRSLASLGYTPDSGALQQVWENAIILLGDSNFMCLAWSVSILTGMGYAYLTVIGQLLGPCGYSDNLVGDSIAAFSAANAVGCILYVYMLSHEGNSRSYQAYQVWFSASLALCLAIALVTASPGEPVWVVVVLWSILGMAAGPLVRTEKSAREPRRKQSAALLSSPLYVMLALCFYYARLTQCPPPPWRNRWARCRSSTQRR